MKKQFKENLKYALMMSGISKDQQNKNGFFLGSELHLEQLCRISDKDKVSLINDLAKELKNIWGDLASDGAEIPQRVKDLLQRAKAAK